ncbi:MAG: hypothetical protein N3H31_05205 [Candidatus Nezhaarchaeota archaeon]|nr:hypothetical protein [Candidatus Nezhaarchaeota archaeon]
MEGSVDQRAKTWVLLLIPVLAVVLVLVALWASLALFHPHLPWRPRTGPAFIPGDVEFFYIANAVVSTLNAALLAILLVIYIDVYRRTKSDFTIGLVVFSVALFLYALTSNPLLALAFGFRPLGLGPFVLLPSLFTLAAIVILLYLSIK